MPKKSRRRRILLHLGKIAISIVTVSLMTSPAIAAADTTKVISSSAKEVGTAKKALTPTWRFIYGTITAGMTITCIPAAGDPVNRFHCFATGVALYGSLFPR